MTRRNTRVCYDPRWNISVGKKFHPGVKHSERRVMRTFHGWVVRLLFGKQAVYGDFRPTYRVGVGSILGVDATMQLRLAHAKGAAAMPLPFSLFVAIFWSRALFLVACQCLHPGSPRHPAAMDDLEMLDSLGCDETSLELPPKMANQEPTDETGIKQEDRVFQEEWEGLADLPTNVDASPSASASMVNGDEELYRISIRGNCCLSFPCIEKTEESTGTFFMEAPQHHHISRIERHRL